MPLLPLILVLYLIFLWSDHRGEYNIIVCIVYNETTERRLMDAPPPIVKDRLRGRKHYYYNQPHHLCSKSGKWGKKRSSERRFTEQLLFYMYYYCRNTLSPCRGSGLKSKTIKIIYNILYLYDLSKAVLSLNIYIILYTI